MDMNWRPLRSSEHQNRASFASLSSISSHESGGSGVGRIKPSFRNMRGRRISSTRTLPVCLNEELRRQSASRLELLETSCSRSSDRNRAAFSLLSSRQSAPVIARRLAGAATSASRPSCTKNEEWGGDALSFVNALNKNRRKRQSFGQQGVAASASCKTPSPTPMMCVPTPKPKSSLKKPSLTGIMLYNHVQKKKRMNVSFSVNSTLICYENQRNPPIPNSTLWYESKDHAHYVQDSLSRAGITRRLMKYASTNENTYKSSTGLVSAPYLQGYLSCPQEIIGIEHLLAGQCTARSSLRRHHITAVLEEVKRQKHTMGGVRDPDLLADMLSNNSTISAHMAKERAAYSLLLE